MKMPRVLRSVYNKGRKGKDKESERKLLEEQGREGRGGIDAIAAI